jgi:hypothetical protein
MLKYIIILLSFNLCFSETSVKMDERVEDAIEWKSTGILFADTCVDGIRSVPYDCKVRQISVQFQYAGSSDSTILDIKNQSNADTSSSILGSANYIMVKSGDYRHTIFTLPTPAIELEEGQRIRMDVLKVAKGLPRNFSVTIYINKNAYKK